MTSQSIETAAKKEDQKLEWNLASYFVTEISEMFNLASAYAIKRDYPLEFSCLFQIRKRISPSLSETELTEFKNMEVKLNKITCVWNNLLYAEPTATQQKLMSYFFTQLNLYNDKILYYLKLYGMYIPLKKDKTNI